MKKQAIVAGGKSDLASLPISPFLKAPCPLAERRPMGRMPLFLVVLVALVSCLGDQQVRKVRESLGAATNSSPPSKDAQFAPPLSHEPIYWDSGGKAVKGLLQINDSFGSVVYVRGTAVDAYLQRQNELKKNDQVYCVVFTFNDPRGPGSVQGPGRAPKQ